jgi:hypothetical protein
MRYCRLRADLALLRESVEVAVGFGLRSLEGLVDVAELIEQSVYEPRSLRRTAGGFQFTLLNPPLRMGAFSSVKLLWDGATVEPSLAAMELPRAASRTLGSVTRADPITIPIGQRTAIAVQATNLARGRHHVRLELRSVAVPPLVWIEFTDELRDGPVEIR